MSWVSPGTHESSTRGPGPDPHVPVRAARRRRTRPLAKCSCATASRPAAHSSPTSRRNGSSTSFTAASRGSDSA